MKHLVVVQGAPTQFDVPLYNYLQQRARFRLTVVYTQTGDSETPRRDPETGHAPRWDHLDSEQYHRIDLSTDEADAPARVAARLVACQPDLVLLSGYFPALHRKLVKPLKRAGIRVGLRSDNTLLHSDFSGLKGLGKRLLLPVWLRRYDSWHPVGSLSSRYLESVSGVARPTFLFPYNVDNQWFATRSAECASHRQEQLVEMGFEPGSFVVLGILKWHRREDPLLLVRAFAELQARHPRARLVLVGDGPLHDEVIECIAPFRDKVHLPGYVPYSRLPALYALADVFVHPAPGEPWGVSVNEALACGVPVIVSTGVGSGLDLVEEGETGWTFPAGDSGALVERLERAQASTSSPFMHAACREKMEAWSYAQTASAFSRALGVAA